MVHNNCRLKLLKLLIIVWYHIFTVLFVFGGYLAVNLVDSRILVLAKVLWMKYGLEVFCAQKADEERRCFCHKFSWAWKWVGGGVLRWLMMLFHEKNIVMTMALFLHSMCFHVMRDNKGETSFFPIFFWVELLRAFSASFHNFYIGNFLWAILWFDGEVGQRLIYLFIEFIELIELIELMWLLTSLSLLIVSTGFLYILRCSFTILL